MRPSKEVWAAVRERDGVCVACGRHPSPSTFQHRVRVGMGGSRHRPGPAEGLLCCVRCNTAFEASRQAEALEFGWKIPASFPHVDATTIPVYYVREEAWFLLTDRGARLRITESDARSMMAQAYGSSYVG